jgi:hypothetical protein
MHKILLIAALFCSARAHTQPGGGCSFYNEYKSPSGGSVLFNWKVYMVANADFLQSINQVEYYLDPSYSNSAIVVRANPGNQNFTLCSSGQSEFTLRIKVIFKSPAIAPTYMTYKLDLRDPNKRKANYFCAE